MDFFEKFRNTANAYHHHIGHEVIKKVTGEKPVQLLEHDVLNYIGAIKESSLQESHLERLNGMISLGATQVMNEKFLRETTPKRRTKALSFFETYTENLETLSQSYYGVKIEDCMDAYNSAVRLKDLETKQQTN